MKSHSQRGVVYLISLGVVGMAMTYIVALFVHSASSVHVSQRATRQLSAFQLADAALDLAVINANAGTTTNISTTTLGNGTYWAELTDLGSQRYQVTAHGASSGEQRNLEAIIQRTPKSVFQYAVFGYTKVDIKNGAMTDSYNSTQGNYNPAAPGTKGNIGTNSTQSNQVKLDNGAVVNGQAIVGSGLADPNPVVEIKNGAIITGNPKVVSAPYATGQPTVNTGGLPCNQKLELKNGDTATLTQAGSPYCYSEVEVDNSSILNISGKVELYTGKLVVKNSGQVNYSTTSKPAPNFIVQITSTTQVSIDNSALFVGAIYAPNATADIKNSSIFYGSIVAKEVKVDNSACVHYDDALKTVGPTGSYKSSVVFWRDL
jgi:hypothetical protein